MLEKPPVDFLVSSNREPFVLMHMPKRRGETRAVVPDPTTAVDDAPTPTDAPPPGTHSGAASNSDCVGEGQAGAEDIALALETLTLKDRCSHCGTHDVALKRCSRCKQVSYCGAACQNAAWKGHKTMCVTEDDVSDKVIAAVAANDWQEVLKWEGRMGQLMADKTDAHCDVILEMFATAHGRGMDARGSRHHTLSGIALQERRVELLGKMQRFRDQGDALCILAEHLLALRRDQESIFNFKRARGVAEAHGFFSVECMSCLGLGKLAMKEGRAEEGVDLLRNALACSPLNEGDANHDQLLVLQQFTDSLFDTHAIDEVEPLVSPYRKAARAQSDKQGRLDYTDLHSLYASARLHEVLPTRTPCCDPLCTALPVYFATADTVV